MNNDLISREALKRVACVKFYTTPYYKHILDLIDDAPTVKVPTELLRHCFDCKACGYKIISSYTNYCPNCGAKNEGDEE